MRVLQGWHKGFMNTSDRCHQVLEPLLGVEGSGLEFLRGLSVAHEVGSGLGFVVLRV